MFALTQLTRMLCSYVKRTCGLSRAFQMLFCPEEQRFHLSLAKMTGFQLLTPSSNLSTTFTQGQSMFVALACTYLYAVGRPAPHTCVFKWVFWRCLLFFYCLKSLTPQISSTLQGFTTDTNIWFVLSVFLFVLRKWRLEEEKKNIIQQPWARCVPSFCAVWAL